MDRLARAILDEYGMKVVFHPHADSHVDTNENVGRFLENTDPDLVTLCLDTGHISYCGGDNLALIRDYPSRIGYVHLKQVDPEVLAKVQRRGSALRTRGQARRDVRAAPWGFRRCRRCSTPWNRWGVRCLPLSNRIFTRVRRMFRHRLPPARCST